MDLSRKDVADMNIHDRMLRAIQRTYRKHYLHDSDIGWEELSDELYDTLCEAMGDEEYCKWLEAEGRR